MNRHVEKFAFEPRPQFFRRSSNICARALINGDPSDGSPDAVIAAWGSRRVDLEGHLEPFFCGAGRFGFGLRGTGCNRAITSPS